MLFICKRSSFYLENNFGFFQNEGGFLFSLNKPLNFAKEDNKKR